MANDMDAVIRLAEEIKALKTQLEAKEAELQRAVGGAISLVPKSAKAGPPKAPKQAAEASSKPSPAKGTTAPSAKTEENLRGAVRDLLNSKPGVPYDGAKVAKELNIVSKNNRPVRKALQRLFDRGEINKVSQGVYAGKLAKKGPPKKR